MRCPLLLGHPQDAARVPRRAVLSSSPPVRQESPIAPIIEGTKKRDSETLPPRVLVAGRLQCGAARAGVRRGHGECAELAHLARGSSKLFTARHAENGPLSREVGENTILAQWSLMSRERAPVEACR